MGSMRLQIMECTKQEEFKKLNLFKIQIGRVLGKQFLEILYSNIKLL